MAKAHVLHGIDFRGQPRRKWCTLLGRNGRRARTTTMKALMGILTQGQGNRSVFDGHDTIGLPARAIARWAWATCP